MDFACSLGIVWLARMLFAKSSNWACRCTSTAEKLKKMLSGLSDAKKQMIIKERLSSLSDAEKQAAISALRGQLGIFYTEQELMDILQLLPAEFWDAVINENQRLFSKAVDTVGKLIRVIGQLSHVESGAADRLRVVRILDKMDTDGQVIWKKTVRAELDGKSQVERKAACFIQFMENVQVWEIVCDQGKDFLFEVYAALPTEGQLIELQRNAAKRGGTQKPSMFGETAMRIRFARDRTREETAGIMCSPVAGQNSADTSRLFA